MVNLCFQQVRLVYTMLLQSIRLGQTRVTCSLEQTKLASFFITQMLVT